MEDQLLASLSATLASDAAVRNDAERQLSELSATEGFPSSLISIAGHASVPRDLRQAALISLKRLVQKSWSPVLEEYQEANALKDATKDQVRQSLLALATSGDEEGKVVRAASDVVSKIASADFPESWPSLLPTLLQLVGQANPAQLHSTLVVLGNLVEDGFDEEQFSGSAAELIQCLYNVSVDGEKKLTSRALAVSIFRACFDTMELVYQTNKASVKSFMQQASDAWTPFFIDVLKMSLPTMPTEEEEGSGGPAINAWRGVVALKTQVVKALYKIQTLFPHLLTAHTLSLFSAVWEGLQLQLVPYVAMYIEGERQGRMEDADRLPYTLDFLVMEEIDYIQTLLGTATVRRELDAQLEANMNTAESGTWISQVMAILVGYSQITIDDEGMWEIDVNIFLAEETAETSNYSTRSACSNFIVKLCNWSSPVVQSLLSFSKSIFADGVKSQGNNGHKMQEATLFVLKQVLDEFRSYDKAVDSEAAGIFLDHIRASIQDPAGEHFLTARGYILAGTLVTAPGDHFISLAPEFAQQTLNAADASPWEIVKVSCIRVMQEYMKALPASRAQDFQKQTVAAISKFVSKLDLEDLKESEDLLDTLVETLRDTIMAAPNQCLDHPALDILFTLASQGASSFQTTMLVNEAFESITSAMAAQGPDSYAHLCAKVLPTLTGALDVADMTDQASLSDMAVSLLASLAENGPKPLPQGFVATVMPKLYRLLFSNVDFTIHQSATLTIKHLLAHDPEQVFAWRDIDTGKGGLEIILLVIDRLLGPGIEDASAAEVGGLAVELVERAGAEKLGPYLMQLLQIVAIRLSTASHANFIQNLVMVFARLCLSNAQEVIDFLSQVQVPGPNSGSGLEVVMRKWLENCVNFSGFDEIRQNVVALTNIYNLNDPRLSSIPVQGDLVVQATSRIKTRSQSKWNPDQYSTITVPLKLIKVLIQELVASSPIGSTFAKGARPSTDGHASDDDDDDWEDEPNILDLASPSTRSDLMGLDESRWNYRSSDDETQRYVVGFFHSVGNDPRFQELYHALNDNEREKLHALTQVHQ